LKSEESVTEMITKEEYQDKLEAQLRDCSSRIYILKFEVERQPGEDQAEHKRQIMEILDQAVKLEDMIEELKRANGKKWIELKDSVREAQADLQSSLETTMLEIL
jgi:hypothetical protein